MNASRMQHIWYRICVWTLRFLALFMFRYRAIGQENIPRDGAALVISNHQSHLDPVLVGIAFERDLFFLARATLFRSPLGWLIRSVNAIPIDLDGSGLAGLKAMLKLLRKQKMVLIFPEGTRSPDGELQPFKPGFSAIARRAKAPLLPVAIEGTFAAWPRTRRFPRFGRVRLCIGKPISANESNNLEERALVDLVQRRIAEALADARQM